MIVFRISSKQRITDLSGTGAKLHGGRWNESGRAVLYCAENISLAMLEILVQADNSFLQKEFAVAFLKLNPALRVKELLAKDLPAMWRANPHSAVTQQLGNDWLNKGDAEILKVPSAVNPLEKNVLINPELVGKNDIEMLDTQRVDFDTRLIL